MSRIEYGDPTWRIHDHIYDSDGRKIFIFRRWGVEKDYYVRAEVFQPVEILQGRESKKVNE